MRAHNGTVLYDTSWIAKVDYTDQLAKKRRASSKKKQSNPTNIRKDRTKSTQSGKVSQDSTIVGDTFKWENVSENILSEQMSEVMKV